jgi:hypothetical protein
MAPFPARFARRHFAAQKYIPATPDNSAYTALHNKVKVYFAVQKLL